MIPHPFKPDPHGRDVCDAKVDEDGRTGFCGAKRSEHMDEVHALKVQLVTAIRERDEARVRADAVRRDRDYCAEQLDTARREVVNADRVIACLVRRAGGEVAIPPEDQLTVDGMTIETSRDIDHTLRIRALAAPADGEEGKHG